MCLALYSKPTSEVCPISPQRAVLWRSLIVTLLPHALQLTDIVPASVFTFIHALAVHGAVSSM